MEAKCHGRFQGMRTHSSVARKECRRQQSARALAQGLPKVETKYPSCHSFTVLERSFLAFSLSNASCSESSCGYVEMAWKAVKKDMTSTLKCKAANLQQKSRAKANADAGLLVDKPEVKIKSDKNPTVEEFAHK
eukprot:scaffold120867_cov37-Attheya_sp.AAC.4